MRPFFTSIAALFIGMVLAQPAKSAAPEFLTYASYPQGKPFSFANGDFVGNGRSDLAVLNATDDEVTILLANSDGTLKKPVKYPIGKNPRSIAVGDVNGDGKLDIIVANYGNPTISLFGTIGVLLGNGDGTFRKAIQTKIGSVFPKWLSVGDFNGDGHLDVMALATGQTETLTVFLGKGDGTFRTGASYVIGRSFSQALVADFNNDGKLDVAVLYDFFCNQCNLTVLLGNGDGTFQSGIVTQLTGHQHDIEMMVAGDFNNDGFQDLVVRSGEFLAGKGDGTFSVSNISVTGSFVAGDLNGDGKLDLVEFESASQFRSPVLGIALGNGDGTFQQLTTLYDLGPNLTFVGLPDLRGDGKLDVVALNDNSIGVALGNGNGTLQAATLCCSVLDRPMVSADINGDSKADIVWSWGDSVNSLLGNGDGTFTQGGSCPFTNTLGLGLRLIDLNHDNNLDILAGNGNGNIGVCLGNGDGTFQPAINFFAGGINQFEIADFNGDGNLDLAVPTGGLVNILFGNGDGTFQSPRNQGVGTHAAYIVPGDFNGDGKVDLIVLGSNNKSYILLGKGNGTFQKPAVIAGAGSSVRTGDFNRDGKLDLAIFNNGSITILLGEGNGKFQTGKTYGSGFLGRWTIRDFNGDGRLDLLAINATGFGVIHGNGDGTFQPQVNYPVSGTTASTYLAAADFNGDHKLDLAIAGSFGTVIVFNTGSKSSNLY